MFLNRNCKELNHIVADHLHPVILHGTTTGQTNHLSVMTTPLDPEIGHLNDRQDRMLTVLLVRHGETVHNVAKVYAGITDSELTIHGMNQAKSLGEALKGEPVTHVFSSDLKRAYRTASAIVEHHPHISVVQERLFRERDFGDLEGKPWQIRTSDVNKSTAENNRESTVAMKQRAAASWNWILEQVEVYDCINDLFVVVVSHGSFLGALLGIICTFYATHTPSRVFWGNTAYLKFTVDQTRDPIFKVERINENSHIKAVLRQKNGVGSSKYDENQKTVMDFFSPRPDEMRQRKEN